MPKVVPMLLSCTVERIFSANSLVHDVFRIDGIYAPAREHSFTPLRCTVALKFEAGALQHLHGVYPRVSARYCSLSIF